MRLKFNPTHEIFFKKCSDDRMTANIEVENTTNVIFSFKVKCTNPQLFEVHPLKAISRPGQVSKIQFTTIDPVNLDFAKQLAINHKFLIEYVPITSEYAVPNFKNHQTQKKKYYINMNSIRGSNSFQDHDKISVHSELSNKMSYISMKNEMKKEEAKPRSQFILTKNISSKNGNIQQMQEKYLKLKQQLDDLHRQRQQIVNKMSNTSKTSALNLKKVILMAIFIFIGSFLGQGIKKYVKYFQQQMEIQRKKQEQKSSKWNPFGLLDFLYDEVQTSDT